MTRREGREHEPEMTALAAPAAPEGKRIEVRAPAVGLWREAPAPGTLVRPGDTIGRLEVLGVLHRLIAPVEAHGIVVAQDAERAHTGAPARRAVEHGQLMLVLDPDAAADVVSEDAAAAEGPAATEGPVFRAPTSGRFYARPGPDRPPFVQPGDELTVGQTVCLLEVMKTFHRVTYGGKGLPERARVQSVLPAEESDLNAGDIILVLA
jgi:acetyl-CoA carboxylase biotin carboxyl carrier protein